MDTPLIQSKPSVLPPSALQVAAIIEAFNPGMQGGRAIAELILGLIEPSGRLPITFPRHAGQLPVCYNGIRGQHGDRYADLTQSPLFAFGEGLSYTSVEYSELNIDTTLVPVDGVLQVSVTLTNTGLRPAIETVQVYVSDTVTSATWAERELKAFRQVTIASGQTVNVQIELGVADCTIVDVSGRRVVEPGEFVLSVGPSSRTEHLLSAVFEVQPG